MISENRSDPSPRLVRLAALAYLAIFACGLFAEFGVRQRLLVPGDAGATAAAIAAAEPLFRGAVAAELVMLLCDVFLAAVLYALLRPVHRTLAALAAFLRVAHAAVVGAGLLQLFLVLKLAVAAGSLADLAPAARHAQVLLHLEAHGFGYVVGLVFFGLHCLVLGGLLRRGRLVPGVLGVLLMIAGLGYLVDGFANALLADYAAHAAVFQTIVFAPAFVGELAFCLWLLFRGVRRPAGTAAA